MNFIVFSPNFWPKKDAEAYCATRFASALTEAGHNVHVITEERPDEEYKCSYKVLLNEKVVVTRLEDETNISSPKYFNPRWLTWRDEKSALYDSYARQVKQVLSRYERPVLITRSLPMSAVYIGWKCKQYAHKWIAHLSDPIPWGHTPGKMGWFHDFLVRFWLKRVFRDADAISVTCRRVQRYYVDTLGRVADRNGVILAEHIGDKKLNAVVDETLENEGLGRGVVLHSGDMYFGRGIEIVKAVESLNDEGIMCEFVQDRPVIDSTINQAFAAARHCYVLTPESNDILREKARYAQVSFVPDFNSSLAYSPFLMSKFVYQVFEDKPIVVLSKRDSAKHDYCERYPEAGLFFADIDKPNELRLAIKRALDCDRSQIDRNAIRQHFSSSEVASRFIRNMSLCW